MISLLRLKYKLSPLKTFDTHRLTFIRKWMISYKYQLNHTVVTNLISHCNPLVGLYEISTFMLRSDKSFVSLP